MSIDTVPDPDPTMGSGPIRVTATEFDACWELLELGECPNQFALPSPGRTAAGRRWVLANVLDGLRRRGLATEHGPIEALTGALGLLASPEHELDLRQHGPGGAIVGVGAVSGHRGVVAAQRGDHLTLHRMDRARVPSALLGLAGPISAGTGRPVTLAADLLDDAGAARPLTASALADQLVRRGLSRPDANSVAHMCRGVRAAGQLGATGRSDGLHRRAPWVVGFHRNDTGHFVQLRRPDPGGRTVSVTLGPTNGARLTGYAAELVEAVS